MGRRYGSIATIIAPLLLAGLSLCAFAQEITPAHEQDLADAQNALESAVRAQAEKYAGEPFKQAQEWIAAAREARSAGDALKFSHGSRLARAYAELARAQAEIKAEEAKLMAAQEEIRMLKAELTRLQKMP